MARKTEKKDEQKNAPAFLAFHVPDRENAAWTRIGAAWDHKDGEGFTLTLDLVPMTTGRIVLRKFELKQEGASA